MPIVSNSSPLPLIALARIQRLDLVPAVLQSILIPPAVAREVEPSIPDLPAWVSVRVPSSQRPPLTSRGRLGDGEQEAIALAIEIGADAVLMDERAGQRVAEEAGPDKGNWLKASGVTDKRLVLPKTIGLRATRPTSTWVSYAERSGDIERRSPISIARSR